MLNSPSESLLKDAALLNSTRNTSQKKKFQHGIQQHYPILLGVPAETLTCITAHLDPPSLLSVAQVNTYLNRHVNDENTWRRAFICQFLGVGPQSDFNDKYALLLRRSESSWRNEFVVRYRLRRRWERSRNGSTTHIPVHSTISGMHQMPSNGFLISSLEYGIVARSVPLTGKILSGYLDASGSAAGLGIGNPNAEFTPNISSCAMASDGGTAKLVWGSRLGDVLFMSVPKAMESGSRRSAAEVRRCTVADEHEGAVVDAVWLTVQPEWAVTGGADGTVKIWDAKNAACLWSSPQDLDSVIPDSCVKVSGSAQFGFVVSVFKSGYIRIWVGFDFTQSNLLSDNIKEIVVDCPIRSSSEGHDSSTTRDLISLDPDSSESPSVLVGYENDCYFYRIQVDPSTLCTQTIAFGEPYAGSISTIAPFFLSDKTESSIVFTGDQLGCISLYDWDADPHNMNPRINAITPLKKIEAHADGASVTSIGWNGLVLVSGSVRGAAYVFDGMTFELLRRFESPHPRVGRRMVGMGTEETERQRRETEKVRSILLGPEKDVLFMGIGNKVVSWKAGPVPKYIRSRVRSRNVSSWTRRKRTGQSMKQFDYLTQDIIDSQDIMEDEAGFSACANCAHGREDDQREGLATLGLNEVEAVEYVLMLSRDEANERTMHEASAERGATPTNSRYGIDEGVFEGDFDDDDGDHRLNEDWRVFVGNRSPSMPMSASSNIVNSITAPSITSSNSSGSTLSFSGRSSVGLGHPIPGAARITRTPSFSPSSHSSNSGTNTKIQISPPYRAEPLEAGVEWREGDGREYEGAVQGTRLGLEDHYFPPIGIASKNANETQAASRRTNVVNSSPTKSSVPSRSAWSTPLTTKLSPSSSNKSNPGDKAPDMSPSSALSRSARSSTPAVASGSSRVPLTASRPFFVGSRVGVELNASPRFDEVQDDDLRFALELSLAEAKSAEKEV